jgi:hypothetical protein
MANEDAYGLFEAVYALNTRYPSRSIDENRQLAMDVLRDLLTEGLIALYREDRGTGSETTPCEVIEIPSREAVSVLSDVTSWEPYGVEDEPGVAFMATERGYEVWRGL